MITAPGFAAAKNRSFAPPPHRAKSGRAGDPAALRMTIHERTTLHERCRKTSLHSFQIGRQASTELSLHEHAIPIRAEPVPGLDRVTGRCLNQIPPAER